MPKKIKFSALFISIIFTTFSVHSEETSRLYKFTYRSLAGAGIGAGAGLASLAISDNPSGNINNVARGASLGLYGGIIWAIIADQNESNITLGISPENAYFSYKF